MSFTPTPSKAAVIGAGVILSILGPTGGTTTAPVAISEPSGLKFDGMKMGTTTNPTSTQGTSSRASELSSILVH